MPAAYRVGGRIPDVVLPRAGTGPDGDLVPARGRAREGVALLFPDRSDGWPDYLRRLADVAPDLADWDGRVIAVAPAPESAWADLAGELAAHIWIVHDPDGRLRPAPDRTTPAATIPVAAIVDRYGEIYHVWPRDHEHAGRGPAPRELEEWLRFLALQCPE
jgi:hypothetical protein